MKIRGPCQGPDVCHLNFIENLPILGPYYGNTMNGRDLCFCMLARYMLKAKTVQYEVMNRLGSWFYRYPIFKVYTIMYNSAGKFSTNVETTIFKTRFPTRSPYSIEQAASSPVQWSRGASPPGGGGVFSPGRACQRCINRVYSNRASWGA